MMKKITPAPAARKIAALFTVVLVSVALFALDWPSRAGIPVSSFGENDRGTASPEISFRSEGPVYPSDLGELVFYQDASNSASRFPSPLGSWIAVDHGDNIIGLYSHFEGRKDIPFAAILEKETILAESGRSGWTKETGFSFAFFDRKERRWVNPSIIISPMEDTQPPVIRRIELRGITGLVVNPAQARAIPQGTYTVYVDAYDTITGSAEALAPNRIICTLNGAAADELKFEFMTAKNGRRMIWRSGLVPAEQVYRSWPGYEAGSVRLSRGQAVLNVDVRDIAENSRSLSFRLAVE